MYLKKILIENNGCISKVDFEMPFNDNKDPKPLIIAGENGTGKSILISHIADAILEMQNRVFPQEEILPANSKNIGSYSYFRIVGGYDIKIGTKYSLTYEKFDNDIEYIVKSGNLETRKNDEIRKKFDINKKENYKDVLNLNDDKEKKSSLEKDFTNNSYCYFTPNRFEKPHWQVSKFDNINMETIMNGYLKKPFILSSIQDKIFSWILDVFLDSSIQTEFTEEEGKRVQKVLNEPQENLTRSSLVKTKIGVDKILSKILKQEVSFQLGYRNNSSSRLQIINNEKKTILPSISNLSTGQSVLFNLFCTIIKYGENKNLLQDISEIQGIVLIDEIDLHLHSDLQKEVLPELIALFPKIQFIITTHSPLFLLGMEKKFGEDGIEIREMPDAKRISAERFSEFNKAFEYYKNTKSFEEEIKKSDKDFILFVEGESDKTILENAWKKLFPDEKMSFNIHNAFSQSQLRVALKNCQLFTKSPNKTFIGMWDFDEAYNAWNGLKNSWKEIPNRKEIDGLCKKHSEEKGYAFLLPIPIELTEYASRKYEGTSTVAIELLFYSCKPDLFEKKSTSGGGHEIKPKDKTNFATKTAEFLEDDFKNFKPIFSLIEKIIKKEI